MLTQVHRQRLLLQLALGNDIWAGEEAHFFLKLFELVIFPLSVIFNLFLGFVLGVFYPLRSVCDGVRWPDNSRGLDVERTLSCCKLLVLSDRQVRKTWACLSELSFGLLSRPGLRHQYCDVWDSDTGLTSRRVWMPLEFCADCCTLACHKSDYFSSNLSYHFCGCLRTGAEGVG